MWKEDFLIKRGDHKKNIQLRKDNYICLIKINHKVMLDYG